MVVREALGWTRGGLGRSLRLLPCAVATITVRPSDVTGPCSTPEHTQVWLKLLPSGPVTVFYSCQLVCPTHMPHVQLDLYYNGFCNSVLWQLFHYVPLNIDSWQKMAEHRAMQMQWQAYQVDQGCKGPGTRDRVQ